jgi:hypothetical protein
MRKKLQTFPEKESGGNLIARKEFPVFPFQRKQFPVLAPLDDASMVQDHDVIGIADSRKPVGYDECRTPGHQGIHPLLNEFFRPGVDG